MNLTVQQKGDVTLLTLTGELTLESACQLRDGVSKRFDDGHRDFVVDLSQLEGVDSAGLEALTALQRRCEEHLGMVRFCGAPATVRKIFELTRLDRSLVLHDRVEEALGEFQVIR